MHTSWVKGLVLLIFFCLRKDEAGVVGEVEDGGNGQFQPFHCRTPTLASLSHAARDCDSHSFSYREHASALLISHGLVKESRVSI